MIPKHEEGIKDNSHKKPCEKGCITCFFSTDTYKLYKKGYYPPESIYLQCNVPVSEQLRNILPSSFYRLSAIKVGVIHPEENIEVFDDRGNECPCWKSKNELPAENELLDHLAGEIEAKGAKVTFGLQPNQIEIIEKDLSLFENAKYSYQIWKDIGKKIGWEPLTAALFYFKEKDTKILSMLLDLKNKQSDTNL